MTQSWLGRLLGYATVRIESANEASGFGVISDLRQPLLFYRTISEMVEAKQGKTVPYWMPAQRARPHATASGRRPQPIGGAVGRGWHARARARHGRRRRGAGQPPDDDQPTMCMATSCTGTSSKYCV